MNLNEKEPRVKQGDLNGCLLGNTLYTFCPLIRYIREGGLKWVMG